ncbi:hypothetical protein MJD09_01330 [bacterium]|nr:hypothetical protein [bacterium]
MAQDSRQKIYAAVLSNRSYTVGAKNLGVGLFVGNQDGSEWQNVAFSNMRTFAIEIFPNHGEGLFYTANGNGVIVSRDGGKTWRVTSGWQVTEVLEAAAVPNNPQIIYVGTAYGLWKSTEYGENLQRLTKRFVNSVHLDVKDPDRIYVGEEDGMVISQDAGKSFQPAKNISDAVNHIAQENSDPRRLYLGTEDQGLFISDDRGKSWQQITTAPKTATVYSVAVDPKNHNIVFASTFADGILRSSDRGKTWQTITNGVDDIPVYKIVLHPDDSAVIYAGTVNRGILRSTDGGESWVPFALDGTHVWELEVK